MAGRRVLVTGISSRVGTALARRLEADPDVDFVAGLDDRPPRERLRRTEVIEADIRTHDGARVIPELRVDAIVHNKIVRRPGGGLSPRAAHDVNVIGTLQLLAACERSPTLKTIVVRGSAGIYGSEPGAPQFFTEETARLYPLRTRFQRDISEIEDLFATFARRHRQVTCTMLRYQPAIGPSLDTQVTRLLEMPVVPTYLGYDPRVQFVHEEDAVQAMIAALRTPVPGAVNVAPDGTIGLIRMLRLARRATLPLPPPLLGPASAVWRRMALGSLSPDFLRLMRYGRALDTRRLREEVGFRPRYSAPAAVQAHLAATREGHPVPAGELVAAR